VVPIRLIFRRVFIRTLVATLVLGSLAFLSVVLRAFAHVPLMDSMLVAIGGSLVGSTLVVALVAEFIPESQRLRPFWLGSLFVTTFFCLIVVASWLKSGEISGPAGSTVCVILFIVVAAGAACQLCTRRAGIALPSNTSLERTRER
jgi:hypothetical protein